MRSFHLCYGFKEITIFNNPALNPKKTCPYVKTEKKDNILVYFADFICDLTSDSHSLYIYSDIVKHSIVGNTQVPLLRIVNVTGELNKYYQQTYNNIHYIPLFSNRINNIEIQIRNSLGDPIEFNFGHVIIVLHFKRRKVIYTS